MADTPRTAKASAAVLKQMIRKPGEPLYQEELAARTGVPIDGQRYELTDDGLPIKKRVYDMPCFSTGTGNSIVSDMIRKFGDPLHDEECAARAGARLNGFYYALDEDGRPYALPAEG